jgi:hypothetical protein
MIMARSAYEECVDAARHNGDCHDHTSAFIGATLPSIGGLPGILASGNKDHRQQTWRIRPTPRGAPGASMGRGRGEDIS